MMSGYDMNGSGWAMMVLLVVVVVAIIGAGWLFARSRTPSTLPSPGALLDARLARGDISVSEHRELRRALATRPAAEGHPDLT